MVKLVATTDAQAINALRKGSEILLILRKNGYKSKEAFTVKIVEKTKIEHCSGCGIILSNFKELKEKKYCFDCYRRHNES